MSIPACLSVGWSLQPCLQGAIHYTAPLVFILHTIGLTMIRIYQILCYMNKILGKYCTLTISCKFWDSYLQIYIFGFTS